MRQALLLLHMAARLPVSAPRNHDDDSDLKRPLSRCTGSLAGPTPSPPLPLPQPRPCSPAPSSLQRLVGRAIHGVWQQHGCARDTCGAVAPAHAHLTQRVTHDTPPPHSTDALQAQGAGDDTCGMACEGGGAVVRCTHAMRSCRFCSSLAASSASLAARFLASIAAALSRRAFASLATRKMRFCGA